MREWGFEEPRSGRCFEEARAHEVGLYSPAGKIFLLDGKYAWFYTQGDVRVQRIPQRNWMTCARRSGFLLGHTELGKEMTGLSLARLPNESTHSPASRKGRRTACRG